MYIAISNSITSSSQMNGAAASGGGGRFSNTYSMAFDGVDDYVGLGTITDLNGGVSAFSTSLWFNYSGTPSTSNNMLLSGGTGVTDRLYIQLIATDTIRYTMGGGFDDVNVGTLTSGTWYNLITVHDGADVDIYLNGTLKGSFTDQVPTSNFATTMKIGNYISGAYWWNGNIDEVSIFNSALSLTDRNTIYGTGTPSDLSSLNPTAWYRMGDNGSYKSPQWLLPENSNKDKLSNFSFNFDGVDDLFSYPEITFLKGGGSYFSISMWVKVNTSTQRGFWCCRSATPDNIDFYINTLGKLILYLKSSVSGNIIATSTSALSNDTWTHIGATFDGTEAEADRIKLYVNGSAFASSSTGTGANLPNGAVTNLNYIGSTWQGIKMLGNIDETAIWNSTLSAANMTSIYNSGTPTTLPITPVAYWKMGEDATFSTNWTVPDGVGSFDATSANMTIEDRVGEAPNSTSNALSYNMDEVDRETDVPT